MLEGRMRSLHLLQHREHVLVLLRIEGVARKCRDEHADTMVKIALAWSCSCTGAIEAAITAAILSAYQRAARQISRRRCRRGLRRAGRQKSRKPQARVHDHALPLPIGPIVLGGGPLGDDCGSAFPRKRRRLPPKAIISRRSTPAVPRERFVGLRWKRGRWPERESRMR